ncbi:MAG TPA: hypothetical protein VNB58_05300 [Gaiellaceae bacterium]|jgi:hypothetical protein|nr:hypothetical protein [Gaiellaceae bacterium]
MTRSSRFLLPFAVIALAASLAVGVPRAVAIDPFPTSGVATLSSDHFQIRWSRDVAPCPTASISQERAGEILGMAERAYDLYSGWGYTAPGALVDISVDDFSIDCFAHGAIPLGTPMPHGRWDAIITPVGPDEIHLSVSTGLAYPVVAHEVFHVFEDAVAPGAQQWLTEGLAEWASVRANAAAGGLELNPDRTMDCVGSECGDTEFDRNGYPGWMLFEYLAERPGSSDAKVKAVLDAAAANPGWSGTQALSSVVQTLGSTLGKFFEDYTTARLTGNFTYEALAGVLPQTQASIVVASSSGAVSPVTLAVNHLAVRYVDVAHGLDTDTGPCYSASLALKVALPAGVASTPYYYANTKGAVAQAFSVSGTTASLTVPWNTCGASPHAYVSLPNETNDVVPPALDGREFTVSGTVTVDKSKPAAAGEAPEGVKVIGPVVQAPTTDPAPDLTLHAPELIRVSAKTRLLRFIVFSSGDGTLKATLGSTWLGSAGLHAGNNDVRFILPTQLLKTLRKTNTPGNVLMLTSYSPGGTQGASVTRRVAMQLVKKTTKPKRRK